MASSKDDYTIRTEAGFEGGLVASARRAGTAEVTRVVEGHGHTDVGLVRKRNEDAFFVDAELGFAVVADGMGGAPAGELASRLAVDAVVHDLTAAIREEKNRSTQALRDVCEGALKSAELAVVKEGRENPVNRGLGCTLTFILFDSAREHFAIGHAGDSRVYRIRGGVLEQLSKDHTLAQESVDEGRLPPDAVRHHPFGHILTRVVGMEGSVEADYQTGEVRRGDGFLLCTDGVIRVLEEEAIEAILEQAPDLESSTARIINDANDRGGPDNSTVVVLNLVDAGSTLE